MEYEIILKLLLSIFLGIILLLSKKIQCKSECFISSILLGIGATISALFLNLSAPVYLVFFGIIIAVFIINNKSDISFPLETMIIILVSFTIGFDYYLLALTTIIITIISSRFIYYLIKMTKNDNLSVFVISVEDKASTVIDVKKILIDIGIKFENIKLTKSKDGYNIELFFNTSKAKTKSFITKVMELKNVIELTSETF